MKRGLMTRDEMLAPSPSLNRLRGDDDRLVNNDDEDPYKNLANAIICVAADDYRAALKKDDGPLIASLQRFFHSAWYRVLTGVDGEFLMNALNKEHQKSLAVTST